LDTIYVGVLSSGSNEFLQIQYNDKNGQKKTTIGEDTLKAAGLTTFQDGSLTKLKGILRDKYPPGGPDTHTFDDILGIYGAVQAILGENYFDIVQYPTGQATAVEPQGSFLKEYLIPNPDASIIKNQRVTFLHCLMSHVTRQPLVQGLTADPTVFIHRVRADQPKEATRFRSPLTVFRYTQPEPKVVFWRQPLIITVPLPDQQLQVVYYWYKLHDGALIPQTPVDQQGKPILDVLVQSELVPAELA
jgi:hypothetical protein